MAQQRYKFPEIDGDEWYESNSTIIDDIGHAYYKKID